MYKIAAMGDKDSIYGFASLGISIFPVTDSSGTSSTFSGSHSSRLSRIVAQEIDSVQVYSPSPTPPRALTL